MLYLSHSLSLFLSLTHSHTHTHTESSAVVKLLSFIEQHPCHAPLWGHNVTLRRPKGLCECELWMSSPPSFQTSFDLHISMQMKRGIMPGVDLFPSGYLNFRGTKARVALHCNAWPRRDNGSTEWQNNTCSPLRRRKCFFFSCRLTGYWGCSFKCRMKKIYLKGLTSSTTGRRAFQHRFPIMASRDREHLDHVICIYIDLFPLLFYYLCHSLADRIAPKVTGTLFWCIYTICKAIPPSKTGFHHSPLAASV